MNYRFIIYTIIFCFFFSAVHAQGNWETYVTRFDNGKGGSILVDLSQYVTAPDRRFPMVVITGPYCNNCTAEGMPQQNEIDKLESILDMTGNTITGMTANVLVGTLTYDGRRVNYYYVSDTSSIRHSIKKMYNKYFDGYKYYLEILPDPEWKSYREFLYPNEQTFTWIENNKIITQLLQAGDSLTTPRQVDFYLYFNSASDRSSFITFAQLKGYDIGDAKIDKENKHPYELRISKVTSVQPDVIWPLTNELREEAKKYSAQYDGWETSVITGK